MGGGGGSNIQKHFELNHNPQNYLFVYMKKVLSEKKNTLFLAGIFDTTIELNEAVCTPSEKNDIGSQSWGGNL